MTAGAICLPTLSVIVGTYYVSDAEHKEKRSTGHGKGGTQRQLVVSTQRQEHLKVTPSQIIYSFKKQSLPKPESNKDARKPDGVLFLSRAFEKSQFRSFHLRPCTLVSINRLIST